MFYFGGHGDGEGDKTMLASVDYGTPNDCVLARLVRDNMSKAKVKVMILNCCREYSKR